MARIALIVKNFHPEVLSLARSLAAQRNEIFFISSRTSGIPDDIDFPVITPFQKWNFHETLKLFPRLLSRPPDVLHFVFTKPDEQPTRADWLLCNLFQPLPRKIVAASFFYSPRQVRSLRLKAFLRNCHAVTWGSHVHLLQARRDQSCSPKALQEVIPPVLDIDPTGSEAIQPDLKRLIELLQHYLVVPGRPQEFQKNVKSSELYFDQSLNFLFLANRSQSAPTDRRIFYLNSQSPNDVLFAIRNARALLLAFTDHSLLELQTYYQWARWSQTPLLIRPEQNEIFPGLVLHGRNGWILDQGEKSLRELLQMNPGLRTSAKPDEHPYFELADSAVNQLSRLFAKAISMRS